MSKLNVVIGTDKEGKEVTMCMEGTTLVGGSCGKGKTNLMYNIIDELLLKYNVDITVVDFKGSEYTKYLNINLVTTKDEVLDCFKDILVEIGKRRELLNSNCCLNIDEYNDLIDEYNGSKDSLLNNKVIIIDECYFLNTMGYKHLNDELLKIITLARPYGISIVLVSQQDRLSRTLMANAFNVIEFPSVYNCYLSKSLQLNVDDGLLEKGNFILLDVDGKYKKVKTPLNDMLKMLN